MKTKYKGVVRQCAGFPLNTDLISVSAQLQWLERWCQNNGRTFSVEEGDTELMETADAVFVKTTAKVEIEGIGSAISTAGKRLDNLDLRSLNTPGTLATGRALAALGFGACYTSASVYGANDNIAMPDSPVAFGTMEDLRSYTVVNKPATYDPRNELLFGTTLQNNLEVPTAYLPVANRIDWFCRFCTERQYPYSVDNSNVRIMHTPFGDAIIASAIVEFQGRTYKGEGGIAVKDPEGNVCDLAIQSACNIALGRALTKAGFGTASCVPTGEKPKDPVTVAIGRCKDTPAEDNPLLEDDVQPPNKAEETLKTTEEKKSQPKPMVSASMPTTKSSPKDEKPAVTKSSTVETYEQAGAFIVPCGKHMGQTVMQADLAEPGYLDWVLEKSDPSFKARNPDFIRAAELYKAK